MSLRTEVKFNRYVKVFDNYNMPAEKILCELEENAEKLASKGIETLFG